MTIIVSFLTTIATLGVAWFLGRERILQEFKLDYSVENVLSRLLQTRKYELRSYDKIKHHVGGFTDDELRRHLVKTGALRFENKDGEEMWGLLSRNEHRLE